MLIKLQVSSYFKTRISTEKLLFEEIQLFQIGHSFPVILYLAKINSLISQKAQLHPFIEHLHTQVQTVFYTHYCERLLFKVF
jgi:hypothetical protein